MQVDEQVLLALLGKKEIELELHKQELQKAKASLLESQALVAELQLRVQELSHGH